MDAVDRSAYNSDMLWDKVNPMNFTEPILPDFFSGEWEPLVSVVNQFINQNLMSSRNTSKYL